MAVCKTIVSEPMTKVLIVDDDLDFLEATTKLLKLLGHEAIGVESLHKAIAAIDAQSFDHVLLDLLLPDGSGLHILKEIEERSLTTQATLITGHGFVQELMGGFDQNKYRYLIKPIDLEKLNNILGQDTNSVTGQTRPEKYFSCLIGESQVMQDLYRMITKVAHTNANVMLMGESGTGKELFAQAIHHASKASGQFVPVNCGAFSRELIASELFGHEKGAFTGAVSRKIGVFERSEDGTLFLDEITEMPLEEQTNLLRALESMRITRLGGTQEIELNCRVVSATNRNEIDLAESQCLREDLYFRLSVFPLYIPPLRERLQDIRLLAQNFLADLNDECSSSLTLSDDAVRQMEAYDWPGNVRELRHAIQRSFIITDRKSGDLVLPSNLASPFSNRRNGNGTSDRAKLYGRKIEDVEKELILTTLNQLDNDKQKAATVLGISLKTLYNRLNEYAKATS